MQDRILLAKSNPTQSLLEHTEDCMHVFRSIRSAYPFVPDLCNQQDFFVHLFYAVFLHDIGKAASGFQKQIVEGTLWNYRHEILSAGYVACIEGLEEIHRRAIVLSVITHHRNITQLREGYATTDSVGNARFRAKVEELRQNIPAVNAFLSLLPMKSGEYLGRELPNLLYPQATDQLLDGYQYAVRWYRNCIEDGSLTDIHSTYGIFLRGFLIACDHLASGGKVKIREAVKSIGDKLGITAFRPFQQKSRDAVGHYLLVAPTGSGKTEAALLWAENNQDSSRRVYYVLPYTASINAMHDRLVNRYGFGESDVGVLHGKAAYFIYKTLMERNYGKEGAASAAKKSTDLTRKLYRPVKVLTPFQILKALFGVKGWEFMLSEMAGGLFIFDEIHVYEPHTAALILRTVEHLAKLGGRFLFLSATFPSFLKQRIKDILSAKDISLDEQVEVERKLLYSPRHRVQLLNGEMPEHLNEIERTLKSGKRVLVVCNTVSRAQEMYQSLKNFAAQGVLLHGRFILRDREEIERKLATAQLLVGTQAVEVSLDIDFDILFTEPAPIDALIQRFGRVNRRGTKGVVPVVIFSKGSDKDKYFYDMDRVERTLSCLKDHEELTEKRVSDLVEQVYCEGYSEKELAEFESAWSNFGDVVENLVPFDESDSDDDLWELVRSLEVIPIRFEAEYKRLKEEKEFFEAMKYAASISLGQGAQLRQLDRISFREDGRYWVVDAKYDDELGLLVKKPESGIGMID